VKPSELPVSVFRRADSILGESLVWEPSTASMMWCDITAGLIHRSPLAGAQDGSDDEVVALPAPVCSFHPAQLDTGAGVVVSLGNRVVTTDLHGGQLTELARIAHAHPGMRLNEGKVDPSGRWITGSMDVTEGEPDGAFYSVAADGTVRTLLGGVGTANGIEWSLDGSLIYVTDTSVGTVYEADYTVAGDIENLRPQLTGAPHDGLVIDADGCLWGALYGEGRVAQYDAEGAELLSIDLPVPNVTSVALGGPDLSTLYVCSARENLTEEQLVAHPLSGSVFAIETPTRGREANVFGRPARHA
jgi:sugar lactone lactonase YvrE